MTNGRLYGNSSNGFSYSPNRSRDVRHDNLKSSFIGANGNRQSGYYYSPTSSCRTSKPSSSGWYDGAGRYHED